MINPFKYRPPLENHDEDFLDWDDNALSNALAWASDTFMPTACDPDHWMNKVADKFWAECSCCLFWRGVVVTSCLMLPLGVLLGSIIS